MKIKSTFYLILLFLLISLKGMAHSKPCSYASSLCAPKPWTSPTVCGCSTSAAIPTNNCPFPQKKEILLKGYFCYPALATQPAEKETSLTAKSAFWS